MAKVLGLKLENFKSFKNLDLPLPKGFTAIVGPNGSGKCLLGDSILFLKDKKISFENLYKEIEKNVLEKKLEGSTEILIPKDKIFVLSVNIEKLKIEEKPILAISRRPESKYAILKTSSGKKIKATLNHPFFTFEKDKIISKPLKELQVGEFILTCPYKEDNKNKENENLLKDNYSFEKAFQTYFDYLPNVAKIFENLFNSSFKNIDKTNLKQILILWRELNKKIKDKDQFSILETLAFSNLVWEKIENIEIIEENVFVYDIQVKDNSNFIANGILVHNSNIVDAFCFVLGKGSSKALRGKSFKDLITALPKRPKEGRVIIFFELDKEDKKKLNIETDVIGIERSIYLEKDETSYRIYKIDASPKDVFEALREKQGSKIFQKVKKTKKISKSEASDIFSKLNLPSHAPNIIQQGDLLKVISMSNLERRRILDEICGIWEFEEKKTRALEELNQAREYLEKLEVRLSEVKSLLSHLEKEVEKLEKYENTKNLLNLLKAIYYFRLYIFYKNRIKKLKNFVDEKKREIENIDFELENKEREKKEILKQVSLLEKEIEDFQKGTYKEVFQEFSKLETELKFLRKEILDLERKLENLKEKKDKFLQEKESITDRLNFLKGEIENLKDNLENNLKEIKKLEESKKEKSKIYFELSNKLSMLLEQEKSLLEKRAKLKAEIQNITQNIKYIEKEIKTKERLLKDYEKEKEDILNEIENLEKNSENINIKDILSNLEKIKEDQFNIKKEIEKILQEISSLEKAREKTLKEYLEEEANIKNLEKYNISYDEAIKKLFKANLPGIIDIVGNLGKTSLEYKTALEASAGGRLNFIVVDTFENTKKIIEFLKKNNLPRLTFLPLDTIRYRETPHINHEKIIGRAIDLIEFEEKYRPIFEFVFYGTYIVKNLDDARELFEIYPNWRFVTLEGDILEPSGAVSGGKLRSKAQISVKIDYSKLNLLKDKLKNLSQALEEKKTYLERLKQKLSDLEKEEIKLKHFLNEAENKKKRQTNQLEKLKSKLENLEIKIFSLKKEIESLFNQKEKLEEDYQNKISILENLEKEINILKCQKEELKNNNVLVEIENIEKELENKKHLVKSLEEKIKNYSLEKEKLSLKIKNIEEDLENLEKEQRLIEETLSLKRDLLEKKENDYKSLKEKLEILEENLNIMKRKKEDLMMILKSLNKEIEKLKRRKEKIKENIFEFEKEIEKAKTHIEDLKKNYPELEFYLDISSKEDIKNILRKKGFENFEEYLEMEISSLENLISKQNELLRTLGPINFQAKEDYKEVYERHKDLLEKWEVYKKEEEKYLNLLREIEERKKEVFLDTFYKVKKYFQEIYEKFGGKGDIYLENEDDPFKGGIIIKATPKGKKLINMNAMSGGEKALAALSFIFAISKLFDAPFYIFDEVDAPLDVKNAALIGKLIKDYSKERDFIVISHREQTISFADNMFGVVMENGLSKVVGIRFGD